MERLNALLQQRNGEPAGSTIRLRQLEQEASGHSAQVQALETKLHEWQTVYNTTVGGLDAEIERLRKQNQNHGVTMKRQHCDVDLSAKLTAQQNGAAQLQHDHDAAVLRNAELQTQIATHPIAGGIRVASVSELTRQHWRKLCIR